MEYGVIILGTEPETLEELCTAISEGAKVLYLDWYENVAKRITPAEFDTMQAVSTPDPVDFIINPIIVRNGDFCTLPIGEYAYTVVGEVEE